MSEEVIFPCKSANDVHAAKVIAEVGMLRWSMDPLMSSKVFRCDKTFATGGADLRLRAMPASMMAWNMSARVVI